MMVYITQRNLWTCKRAAENRNVRVAIFQGIACNKIVRKAGRNAGWKNEIRELTITANTTCHVHQNENKHKQLGLGIC